MEDDYGYLDPLNVRSCYAESKRLGETLCNAWSHQYGVETRIARIFHTYGPGIKLGDGRIFSDLIGNYLAGKPLILYGNGSARRCFCYVTDTMRALFYILLNGENACAYNVGNDEAEVSMEEFAAVLASLKQPFPAEIIYKAPRSKASYLPSQVVRNTPNTGRLRKLGWKPYHSLESGLIRTLERFKALQEKLSFD
jgi:UDP-glucuronate decarboxylase